MHIRQSYDFSVSFLVLSCEANSTYASCMSPCPASCGNLAASSECDAAFCAEGCQCAAGFVMSEGTCVPYSQCGCTFRDRYYPVRALWASLSRDCICHCYGHISFFLSSLSIQPAAEGEICDRWLLSVLWMYQYWCCVSTQDLPEWLCLHHLWLKTWLL